jgi:hypothetical protein
MLEPVATTEYIGCLAGELLASTGQSVTLRFDAIVVATAKQCKAYELTNDPGDLGPLSTAHRAHWSAPKPSPPPSPRMGGPSEETGGGRLAPEERSSGCGGHNRL